MKDLRTRTKDIIDKYADELASLGIKIEVTKRYFETNVGERYGTYYAQPVYSTLYSMIYQEQTTTKKRKKRDITIKKISIIVLFLLLFPQKKI